MPCGPANLLRLLSISRAVSGRSRRCCDAVFLFSLTPCLRSCSFLNMSHEPCVIIRGFCLEAFSSLERACQRSPFPVPGRAVCCASERPGAALCRGGPISLALTQQEAVKDVSGYLGILRIHHQSLEWEGCLGALEFLRGFCFFQNPSQQHLHQVLRTTSSS